MTVKILQFVVLIALLGIGHAEVANRPISVNAIAPALAPVVAAEVNANSATEFLEWAEYKVFKLTYMLNPICS